MLGLPKSTEVSLPLYKKDVLARFDGTSKQKENFNNYIQSLKIVNEISPRSLPVTASETINGIFVIEVALKQRDISQETIDLIFKLIPQHVVLVLSFEDVIRVAIHQSKTFLTEWMQNGYTLGIDGLSVDDIWKNIVEVIGNFQVSEGKTLDTQIKLNSQIQAILNNIEILEKKKNKTKTPRMRYDLHQQIQVLRAEVERLKRS